MKKFFAILATLIATFSAWFINQPVKKEIPIIAYFSPVAGVDSSRFIQSQWLSLWDLYQNPYGEGEPKLREDWSAQLDAYAQKLMAQPKNKRCSFEWHLADSAWVNPRFDLIHHPGNACKDKDGNIPTYVDFNNRTRPMICPWFDEGIKASREKWHFIMSELKKRNVEIDYFSTENEQSYTPWAFVPGQAEAIDNDPRSNEFRTAIGVSSIATTMNFFDHREDFIKLNNEGVARGYQAFVDGMYKPILEIYPKIQISDYAKFYISEKFTDVKDPNGWPLGNDKIKTISNGSDLNYLGPASRSPWVNFIDSLNQARAIVLSNPGKPFWPYMAEASWMTWTTPELYKEHWRHLALMATGFAFWGPSPNQDDIQIVLDIFNELDPKLSWSDRSHLVTELIDWNAEEIKTCGKSNSKIICRVTSKSGNGYWATNDIK